MYLATGAKLTSKLTLCDNVSIAANSVVTKSFGSNIVLVGMPAVVKKNESAWYERDGFAYRVEAIEKLKSEMGIH